MRFDLSTVDGGRSYFLTSLHIEEIKRASAAGERFVTLLVNREDGAGRPFHLLLNVEHVAAALGSDEAGKDERTGIDPELLRWYVGEVQQMRMGSMIVAGKISASDDGKWFIEDQTGYRFLIQPETVRFMRRVGDSDSVPRYVRGAGEEPPIALSTPGSRDLIADYLEGAPKRALVTGASTEVLSFVRGVSYERVRRGERVLVIQPPAHRTFPQLGIHAAAHGAMLTDLPQYNLVVAFNVSNETAIDLAEKVPQLLVAVTAQGRRHGAELRAFAERYDPVAIALPNDEPRLEAT